MTAEQLTSLAKEHTDVTVANLKEEGIRTDYPSILDGSYQAGFKKALELVLAKCDSNWYAPTANDLRNMLYEEFGKCK